MPDRRLYVVTVSLTALDDRAVLLSLVSVLHRRAVHPCRAELSAGTREHPEFTATFAATARQAATLEASLSNLIHVRNVSLEEVTGNPSGI